MSALAPPARGDHRGPRSNRFDASAHTTEEQADLTAVAPDSTAITMRTTPWEEEREGTVKGGRPLQVASTDTNISTASLTDVRLCAVRSALRSFQFPPCSPQFCWAQCAVGRLLFGVAGR